ncbi:MAG: DUF2971 domain-containing protein [Candidatus Omnitrophota bacterium]
MPDLIYHYTNMEGLKGIWESQCLWATHYKYLNDEKEIDMFVEVMSGRGFKREDIKVVHDAYIVFIKKQNARGPFIVSFCDHDDLLSQWLRYGGAGGCAIGFNYEELDALCTQEPKNYLLGQSECKCVIYNGLFSSEDEKFLDKLGNDAFHYLKKIKDGSTSSDSELMGRILGTIPRLKHQGFHEEKEYRIIVARSNKENECDLQKEMKVKYRQKGESLVPYIALFEDINIRLPIKRIIVGPAYNAPLRKEAIEMMIKGTDIEVKLSDIPYLGN